MTILTNQLIIHYNLEKINQDYDFFKIQREDNALYEAKILDLEFINVESVVFKTGHTAYLMCRKNQTTKYDFNEYFMQNESLQNYKVSTIRCEELVNNQILIQLLINALNHFSNNTIQYNNLTGAFYTTRKELIRSKNNEKILQFDALKIEVKEDNILTFSAKRFNSVLLKNKMEIDNTRFNKLPKYHLQKNGTLKRVQKSEDSDAFVLRALKGEKAHIPFLHISNSKQFAVSKMGLLADFLENFTINYGEYLWFNFQEQKEFVQYPVQGAKFDLTTQLKQADLTTTPIYFIDKICTEQSKEHLKWIQKTIQVKYGLNSKVTPHLNKQGMNIIYIHNADYYKQNSTEDLYRHNPNFLTQHLTIESCNEESDIVIKTAIKELLIKNDLKNGNISLVDWFKYRFTHEWLFICKINDQPANYYGMEIKPNGQFVIKKIENDLFSQDELSQYADLLANSHAEGLIKDHNGHINLIRKTSLYSLPDIQRIHQIFQETDRKKTFSQEELFEILNYVESKTKNINLLSKLSAIKAYVTNQNKTAIKIEELFKKFNHRSLKESFNQYFIEKKGAHLFPYFRNKQMKSQIYKGSLDICYWELDNKRARYCVGYQSKGLVKTFDTGVVIREIISINGAPILFEELLPLMDVDFVRLHGLTVLPFPFKYLREYAKNDQ